VFIPANRLTNLPPYVFAVIGQRIRQMVTDGIDVIRLDIGSPDFPPAPAVIESLTQSAHKPDKHGYSGYQGTPAFRQAVARYYDRRFGVQLDPNHEVLPLIGSKEGIVNLCLAYLNEGDTALVPNIGYPSYAMGARMAGADIQWVPLQAEHGFRPDVSLIPQEVAGRAKIFWINYPNNPTGAVIDGTDYDQIVAFCRENSILLASDNPYVEITYDGYRAGSVLQSPGAMDVAVEFMSFSKTYNMAGWRLGAAVGNADILKTLLQVKSNIDSGHFLSIYDAGITALDQTTASWEHERNSIYERRRDRVMAALPDIGLRAHPPQGAIYIWAQVDAADGGAYTETALAQAHVAVAPGGAYGPGGERFVRISLSVPDNRLDEALNRLREWYIGN
jgi:LL-diaminopimelate aminotransferase